jgi:uncharacterized coiled-coil protein SlyX
MVQNVCRVRGLLCGTRLSGEIMAESEEIRRVADRVVTLEEWMMHTDRLLASLNEVVCALLNRLDEQSRRLESLGSAVERRTFPDEEQRGFEDERPPHY